MNNKTTTLLEQLMGGGGAEFCMDEWEDITVGMKEEFQVELRELLEACDAVTPKEINMGYV